jgi:hypothetical protein
MTMLLSIDEAAGVLGLSVVTLRRLAAGGRVAWHGEAWPAGQG